MHVHVLVIIIIIDLVCGEVKDLTVKNEVKRAIGPSLIGAKYGNENFFANLVTEACSK